MKRFFAFFASVFAVATVAFAAEVTPDQAKAIANVWAAENASFGAGGTAKGVFAVCDTNAAKTVLWYQVSMTGGGVLMVAPVTEIEPVVAALEDDPGVLPAAHPLRGLLTSDLRRRLKFLGLYANDGLVARGATVGRTGTVTRGSGVAVPVDDTNAKVAAAWGAQQAAKWARLLAKASARANDLVGLSSVDTEISLIDGFEKGGRFTHWNQGSAGGGACYNYYTPNHAVCGCVATAYAAMLQFYAVAGAPDEPFDNDSGCSYNGVKLSACKDITAGNTEAKTMLGEDGTGAYDWSLFDECTKLDDYKNLTEEQRQLLGRVAFDAGVCVGMGWTDDESGAPESEIAKTMTKVYGFQQARYVSSPKPEQWAKLIYHQLWCNQPVGLSIFDEGYKTGHSVLAVGYGRDMDGADRVRIFAGWGGAGDAWYALPRIDTASVLGGSAVPYSIIQGIVTMVGYADDKVVPVVGQVIPSMDAEVTCGSETVTANTSGYFGARLSPTDAGTVEITCQGKTFSVVIGDITDDTAPAALCEAIPDDIVLLLLNSEAAASVADAKAKALASGKPMLFFSGKSSEAASSAVWQIINDLDDGNVDNFCDKFVIAYFAWNPSAGHSSDGCPSYGLFDPAKYNALEEDHWAFYNGRLAWDDFASCTTNISAGATNYVATAETTNALFNVIFGGLRQFQMAQAGIVLEIGSSPTNAAPGEIVSNSFVVGEEVTYVQAPYLTNDVTGVVWKNVGWTFTSLADDGTTNVVEATSPAATFTPTTNGVNTLTWNWEVDKVRVTAQVESFKGVVPGTLDRNVAWVTPDGSDAATFTFSPIRNYQLDYWLQDGVKGASAEATCSITVPAPAEPEAVKGVSLVAVARGTVEYRLTVDVFPQAITNQNALGAMASDPEWGTHYHANGLVEATLTAPASMALNGIVWTCAWAYSDATEEGSAEGFGPAASFVLSQNNARLQWQWGIDVGATLEAQGWDGANPQAAVLSMGALPAGITAAEVLYFNVPAGWDAAPAIDGDGNVSVDMAPNSEWAAENLGFDLALVTGPESVVAADAEAPAYVIGADSAAGTISVTAPAAYTNLVDGIVYEPASWSVEGGASGTGATAEFAYATGVTNTLTWTWSLAKVRISAVIAQYTQNGYQLVAGAVSPEEVWLTPGETAEFAYTPDHTAQKGISLALAGWACTAEAARWRSAGCTAAVTAGETADVLTVNLAKAAEYYLLGITAKDESGATVAYGTPDPAYTSVRSALMWNDLTAMTMADAVFTNAADKVVSCTGWQLVDEKGKVVSSGSGTTAEYRQTVNNCTFVWLWSEGEVPGPGPDPEPQYAQPTPIAFTTIEATASGFAVTFTNAVKYCKYKLYSAVSPADFDLAASPDQELTAEADGPMTFTAPASAAGRFWKVVAEPGLIPAGD